MHYSKTQIILALFAILAILYAVNIYLTRGIFNVLVDAPTKVSFMVLEPPKDECENCFDASSLIETISTVHNIDYKTKNISYDSALSRKYIKNYEIKNLPAIIVSGDIKSENITSAWEAVSGKEKNGGIVIENLLPYYDIENGKIKGIVSAILIKDETCENCFNENEYLNILEQSGMVVGDTRVYDISSVEGAEIVQNYSITKVPALILSQDAGDYPGFVNSWEDVGTLEEDGWFVLREVQKLNSQYKQI